MKLQIIRYPDKKLREVSHRVTSFDASLHSFLDELYGVMLESNGIGLAAIQVSKAVRVFIINLPDEDGNQLEENKIEFINPVIVSSDGSVEYEEGCLSVPRFYESIERYESIELEYRDRDNLKKSLSADGLLSIAIQHELDHLDGKLFIDKLSYSRRKKFEKEYKQAQKSRS